MNREEIIIRDLLEHIGEAEEVNQRKLASDLGIALGMANAYVKRCVRKGLIKVSEVPARRYRYYLTPKGFAEKSRLTAEYFTESLRFFRRARQSFDRAIEAMQAEGVRRVVVCGSEELAEIAVLCCLGRGVEVAAVVRTDDGLAEVCGVAAVAAEDAPSVERWLVAASREAVEAHGIALGAVGPERVLVPDILRSFVERPRAAS